MMHKPRHAGLDGYLLRARVQPDHSRDDGAIALVFDANLRVLIHPVARGGIVFESQICALPENPRDADRVLEDAAREAAQRPLTEPDCLVLGGDTGPLMLQQRVPGDASADEFETGLAHFLNALTRWRAHTGAL
jgi:hypothetical protein